MSIYFREHPFIHVHVESSGIRYFAVFLKYTNEYIYTHVYTFIRVCRHDLRFCVSLRSNEQNELATGILGGCFGSVRASERCGSVVQHDTKGDEAGDPPFSTSEKSALTCATSLLT